MDKQSEPTSDAASFSDDKSSPPANDLQYISLKIDGGVYGGWYRMLHDGRMELLALATMHRERRTEGTAVEQAQGMLTEFIRSNRLKRKSDGAAEHIADAGRRKSASTTLGDLLYADKSKQRVPEKDWVELVAGIANGDLAALHRLFERTHRIVFTLLLRLANDWQTAEELTLGVFNDVWRQASKYEASQGSVLGWVMNLARHRALDELQFAPEPARPVANLDHTLHPSPSDGTMQADVLRPSPTLWPRLARRIAPGAHAATSLPTSTWQRLEPKWEEVAPGISCKLLATDADKGCVSMLVRLAPGTDYPPHTHAGVEELHLLHGELLIDDRKLYPGDFNRAEPGTADKRVYSKTGCTCVLMTSASDVLS